MGARSPIRQLPLAATPWEVALVEAPFRIEGVETEGLLVVAEERGGAARGAAAVVSGKPLRPLLEEMMTSPAPPCRPARPLRLLCCDRALARRLEGELAGLGVPVERVARTPAVDAAVDALVGNFGSPPPPMPGIDGARGAWLMTLERLCRDAPWTRICDAVLFRFDGGIPELDDAVAVVLGNAGEQRGISVYPSSAEYRRFRAMAARGEHDDLATVRATNLYLEPIDEVAPDALEACRAAGFELPGGLVPWVVQFQGGDMAPVGARGQLVLLSAVQAITALCAGERRDLEIVPVSRPVTVCLGRVTVRSIPLETEPEEPILV